jgi:hypothetical protein
MAGLGRKVFTAGDVLTASDVQNYLMDQTNMVVASTATRATAIASPTDGMVTYNQTNDQLEAYNGTAWVGMSGLQLIKKQTIGTTVSSVAVTDAFSTIYDNYKITVVGGTPSVGQNISLTLGATVTGYYNTLIYQNFATPTTVSATGSANTTSFYRCGTTSTTDGILIDVELQNPFATRRTTARGIWQAVSTTGDSGSFTGMLNNQTSYTGFTLTPSTGTWTGGTIYVYGYGT